MAGSGAQQLSQIRSLLQEPSATNFRKLLPLATDELLSSYIAQHLEEWSDQFRRAESLEEAQNPLTRHAILEYKQTPKLRDWRAMPHLLHLSLMHYGQGNIDTTLQELQHTPSLQNLALRGLQLKNLQSLQHTPELQELLLSDCELNNLQGLGYCTRLESLWLYWCHSHMLSLFYDELSLKPLETCTSLVELKLQKTPLDSFETLALLPKLERLSLLEVPVRDFGWLADLSQLKHLRLEGDSGDHMQQGLPVCPLLETLELRNVPLPLFRSLPRLPNLHTLTLNQVSWEAIDAIRKTPSLRRLNLNRWAVQKEQLALLFALEHTSHLVEIVLENATPDPQWLLDIQKALPHCRFLLI